jgi:glycosyltransferase involved in cell wall biosynthesis
MRARKKYDFVFTFECDLTSFFISFLQTIFLFKKPRHVILQFIMREKEKTIFSKVKYMIMKFCFHSVYRIVCSSKKETAYYAEVFGWSAEKVSFVPFHTDPRYFSYINNDAEENYILSAGRSFRDYQTLILAARNISMPVVIVASKSSINQKNLSKNITIKYDISLDELSKLISKAKIVVLPLQNQKISIGQSVLLQAMSMGKPVIATNTNATVDYIEHNRNGILVSPGNAEELESEIKKLEKDRDLRTRIGKQALRDVREKYLPQNYYDDVAFELHKD